MYEYLEAAICGRFDPEKELKSGERGTVSLLRDKTTRKRYVCRRFAGSGEVYRKLRGIECPYLPRVEEAVEQDGRVLVLEEYIQGDTLAFLLEERPLTEEQAEEILAQICRALKVLHSLGVVHRDVKPENIILRGEEAVLIDFDASRVCKPERNTDTQVMGTTGYAAPEQYGFSQTDARADIYALGILLNEMLTRQHPARELAQGRLRPVIEKCIEVNVDKRYSCVEELLAALEKSASKGKRKRNRAWMLLPAVLLAAAILIGALLPGGDGEQTAEAPTVSETVAPREDENILPQKSEAAPMQESEMTPVPENTGTPETENTTPPAQVSGSTPEPETTPAPENSPEPEDTVQQVDGEAYITAFRYDLDGNGETEEYWFGAVFHIGDGTFLIRSDHTRMSNGDTYHCKVAPAVWRQTGQDEYERVDAFAPLLKDTKVTLRCVNGKHQPTIDAIDDLFGIWTGAIQVNYTDNGTWLYECSAVLAGQKLTAAATTTYTKLGDTLAQTDVKFWSGEAKDHTTAFQYDLDGDGAAEEYQFGVVFCTGENVVRFSDGRVSVPAVKGYINNRTAAPAVWRQTGNGDYELVEEFAPLLENANVTLWCVEGETQPDVWAESDLLGVWPGAIRVTYTTEGTWLYECSAELAGQKLTAASMTTTYFT